VLDGSKCVHHGMIALMETSQRLFLLFTRLSMSFSKNDNDNDVFRLVEANSSDDDEKSILVAFLILVDSSQQQLMKWKLNLRMPGKEKKGKKLKKCKFNANACRNNLINLSHSVGSSKRHVEVRGNLNKGLLNAADFHSISLRVFVF
jgi:hypothetical protein